MPDVKTKIKIAILDMYEGAANQGMRCIRELLKQYAAEKNIDILSKEFDVRLKKEVPDTSFNIYISTGGPGSPLGDEDEEWENKYFNWLNSIDEYNNCNNNKTKKYVLFICHSFQMACRYFEIGNVAKRKSTAFGVFPIHIVDEGKGEPVFSGLPILFMLLTAGITRLLNPTTIKLKPLAQQCWQLKRNVRMYLWKEQ
jgi:GMP synthase-like glutamine amidotransferase